MNIKATFIGKSPVLVNGEEYKLKIKNYNSMEVNLADGKNKWIYGSLSAFLRNWDNIKHI